MLSVSSADLLGGNDCVVSDAASALLEQRAAPRAVVGRLRVLEAALGAVDWLMRSARLFP